MPGRWFFRKPPPQEPPRLPPDPVDWSLAEGEEGEQILPLLLQELESPAASRRERAVELLEEAGREEVIPALLSLLRREEHLMVRWKTLQAVQHLGQGGAGIEEWPVEDLETWQQEVVAGLVQQLSSEQASQRWLAAEALGQMGDARAAPGLAALLRDPNAFVRWAAAHALGQVGGQTVVPQLLPLLEDEDALVRRSAVDALGFFDTEAARKALRRMLRDPVQSVRRNAIEAIARLGDTEAVEAISLALDPGNDLWLRFSAAEALAVVGDHRAVAPLIEVAQDSHVMLRRATIRALGLLRDSRAIPSLLQALHDPDATVRLHAADGLGRIGHEGVIPHLKQMISDPGSVFGRTVGDAVQEAIETIRSRMEPPAQ